MPWKEVSSMEERIRFVSLAESGRFEVLGLCRDFGISRKTGYKWIGSYRQDGREALEDRSRARSQLPLNYFSASLDGNRIPTDGVHAVKGVRNRFVLTAVCPLAKLSPWEDHGELRWAATFTMSSTGPMGGWRFLRR